MRKVTELWERVVTEFPSLKLLEELLASEEVASDDDGSQTGPSFAGANESHLLEIVEDIIKEIHAARTPDEAHASLKRAHEVVGFQNQKTAFVEKDGARSLCFLLEAFKDVTSVVLDILDIITELAYFSDKIFVEKLAHQVFDILIDLSKDSSDDKVLLGCMACFEAFIGKSALIREYFLESGILEVFVAFATIHIRDNPSQSIISSMSCLARSLTWSGPLNQGDEKRLGCLWSFFCKLLEFDLEDGKEIDGHMQCLELLQHMTSPSNMETFFELSESLGTEIVMKLVQFCKRAHPSLQYESLCVLYNITLDDLNIQRVIDAGFLDIVKPLIGSSDFNVSVWAVRVVQNIAAGSTDQKKSVLQSSVLDTVLSILEGEGEGESGNAQRSALYCVVDLLKGLDQNLVAAVDYRRIISALFAMVPYRAIERRAALHGLNCIAAVPCCRAGFFEAVDTQEVVAAFLVASRENPSCLAELQQLVQYLGLGIEIDLEGFREEDVRDAQGFSSLEEVASFWQKQAQQSPGTMKRYTFDIDGADKWGVLQFFSKLRGAKEFEVRETRVGLAYRVLELLEMLNSNAECRSDLIQRMVDSIDTCNDKPIWALNMMEIIFRTSKARGNRRELQNLGKQLLRLQVVHKHALRLIQTSDGQIDDVSVYLYFEIQLRERLDLPVSCIEMWFPNMGDVEEARLEFAAAEAEALSEEDYDLFLQSWEEWERENRREVAESLHWETLKPSRYSFRKSLRDMLGKTVCDAVRFPTEKAEWSFKDLMTHWVATGMDLHNTQRSEQEVKSLERRQ